MSAPDQHNQMKATTSGGFENSSMLGIATRLLLNRRVVVRFALGFGVVVALLTLVSGRTYESTAAFMPQTSDVSGSSLAGVAAQFGFSVPVGEAGESPEFYADLLTSPAIVRAVVEARYDTSATNRTLSQQDSLAGVNLIDLFGIQKATFEQSREAAAIKLTRSMSVSVSRETGVVTYSVSTEWPGVSQRVARRILDLVNEFNLQTRQTQARAEREFVAIRLAEVETRLRQAEDSLQDFLQRNREFLNAPELAFDHDRLSRSVALWQQVVTSVMQAYEQARIDEVRNTPLVTVIQQPDYPVFPERRRLLFKTFVAVVLGAMIGSFIVLMRGFLEISKQTEPDTYSAFSAASREVKNSLLFWRRSGPSRGVGSAEG